MAGWVKLHRVLTDKPIWKCSTPEQKTILVTLLLMVNHEEAEWEWMGAKFKVSPGQTITSLENIAKEAGKGISVQNIRTALVKFEKYGFLTNVSTKTGRLVTIENWELYQSKEENQQSDKQRPNKELTPNKNKENEKNLYIDHFSKWWDAYPRKIAKAAAKKSFDKLKADEHLLNKMLKALELQKQSKQWSDITYIPHPTTYLNQRRWEDEDDSTAQSTGLKITSDGSFKF